MYKCEKSLGPICAKDNFLFKMKLKCENYDEKCMLLDCSQIMCDTEQAPVRIMTDVLVTEIESDVPISNPFLLSSLVNIASEGISTLTQIFLPQ